jgi:hypothetical protein
MGNQVNLLEESWRSDQLDMMQSNYYEKLEFDCMIRRSRTEEMKSRTNEEYLKYY